MKDGLLKNRGWVRQERALSRRTIHSQGHKYSGSVGL
jgi:hypothetical protein